MDYIRPRKEMEPAPVGISAQWGDGYCLIAERVRSGDGFETRWTKLILNSDGVVVPAFQHDSFIIHGEIA
jgi:hypothetical protein